MNTLVYVEKDLILPIGAKLVGSSLTKGDKASNSVGFNWFLNASLKMSQDNKVETKIAELFPEDIFNFVYSKITFTQMNISEICSKISDLTLKPGSIVSITGRLHIDGLQQLEYNPFDPPQISLPKTYNIYGSNCFVTTIINNDFKLPCYFLESSKEIICYMQDKPVEIIGVLKWSPTYEVAGYAINQLLLGAALLLRR